MSGTEDLTTFNKMLSENRHALDKLLQHGVTPGRTVQTERTTDKKTEEPEVADTAGNRLGGSRGIPEKSRTVQKRPNRGGTRLNAKFGEISFTFRPG